MAGHMVPRHVCFDVDGTLFQAGAYIDFNDVASILRHSRPIAPALRRLNALLDLGMKVSFLTNRHESVCDATHRQLRDALGERAVRGVDIIHSETREYNSALCVIHKFDSLRLLKPDFYCGDTPEDQTACAASGTPFFPAEWWAAGKSYFHFLRPEDSPAAISDAADALGYTDGRQIVTPWAARENQG